MFLLIVQVYYTKGFLSFLEVANRKENVRDYTGRSSITSQEASMSAALDAPTVRRADFDQSWFLFNNICVSA